jgi:hypothetical protein
MRPELASFSQQIFQLAGFIATHPGADLIITLDVNFAAQFGAQAR